MPWKSAEPRRALSYSYMPAYLSAGQQQLHAGHEVVDAGWAAGGAREALHRALTETGSWWSGQQVRIHLAWLLVQI